MKFYIETERLILREIQTTDIEGMFALDSNKEVHQHLGNNTISTKEQAATTISFIQKQYKEYGIGRFACIEKNTSAFIGWCGFKYNTGEKERLNNYENFIDIGYRLLPEFWGKGFATEAAIACLEYGFTNLNYEVVYAAAAVDNIGSNKVLQKIGLQFSNRFTYKDIAVNWYALKKEAYGN